MPLVGDVLMEVWRLWILPCDEIFMQWYISWQLNGISRVVFVEISPDLMRKSGYVVWKMSLNDLMVPFV